MILTVRYVNEKEPLFLPQSAETFEVYGSSALLYLKAQGVHTKTIPPIFSQPKREKESYQLRNSTFFQRRIYILER